MHGWPFLAKQNILESNSFLVEYVNFPDHVLNFDFLYLSTKLLSSFTSTPLFFALIINLSVIFIIFSS